MITKEKKNDGLSYKILARCNDACFNPRYSRGRDWEAKGWQAPPQPVELGCGARACHPSSKGSIYRGTEVQVALGHRLETLFEK
jgi:hypothetical protein